MHLVEVVVEGIPGTNGVLKYPFEAGLNAWKQKGTVRLETISALIESLLYPNSDSGSPLGPGRAKMAGMTFNAGGVVYRLIRDYSGKTIRFSQLQPGSKNQFRDLSTDSRFITTTLTRAAKLPSRRVYSSFLIARPGKVQQEKGSIVEAAPISMNEFDPGARLEILKRERASIETVRKLESENDALQNRQFEIEDQLRQLDEPRNRLEQVKAEYEPLRVFDTHGLVTPQILKRLKNYPGLADKKAADLQALEEKAKDWDAELTLMPMRPFWQEVPAFIGIGVALVSFILASFYRKLLALLLGGAGVGLGVFIWGIFQGLKREERAGMLRKNLRGIDAEKAGVEKRFDIESGMVKKFCDSVNVQDTKEIEEMLSRWEELKGELKKAEEEFATVEKRIPAEELRKEHQEIREKQKKVEEELRGIPNASVDPVSLDREIRDLEATVAHGSVEHHVQVSELTSDDDEIQRLFIHASELLDRPTGEILRQASSAISANLATMTGKRMMGIESKGDQVTGFRTSDGSVISWAAADPQMRMALHFGIQFTLWQMIPQERMLPVVLELSQSPAVESTQKLMLAAAGYLAKKSQILALLP